MEKFSHIVYGLPQCLPISYSLSDIFTDLKVVWLEEKDHHVEEDELRVVATMHMVAIVEES